MKLSPDELQQKLSIIYWIRNRYYEAIKKVFDKIKKLEMHPNEEVRTKVSDVLSAMKMYVTSYAISIDMHIKLLETEGDEAIEKALSTTTSAIALVKPIVEEQFKIIEKVDREHGENMHISEKKKIIDDLEKFKNKKKDPNLEYISIEDALFEIVDLFQTIDSEVKKIVLLTESQDPELALSAGVAIIKITPEIHCLFSNMIKELKELKTLNNKGEIKVSQFNNLKCFYFKKAKSLINEYGCPIPE